MGRGRILRQDRRKRRCCATTALPTPPPSIFHAIILQTDNTSVNNYEIHQRTD